jgi:DNA-binding PucR family transcriptional regulator
VPVGRTEVWAWGSSRALFPDFEETVAGIDLMGARAVVGMPAQGLKGFRQTHQEAQEAARVVLLTEHRAPGMIPYSSLSLLAALTSNPGLARKFMMDELGDLVGSHSNAAALRATLLAYLEHGRSPSTAAACLFVAKNTVVYRVNRAEELLGRPSSERELELMCALRLAEALIPGDRSSIGNAPDTTQAGGQVNHGHARSVTLLPTARRTAGG